MKKVRQKEVLNSPGQRILFTGPDGIGNFRPKLDYFRRSVGIGPLSSEATSDLDYLFRPGPHGTPALPKHCYTGAVGWGLQFSTGLNGSIRDKCRSSEVARLTYSSWITLPQFWDKKPSCGSLAWIHSEDHNKRFMLNQQGRQAFGEKSQGKRITLPPIT